MKILLLHLSDIHVKDKNTYSTEKIEKMISAISQEESIDKVFIVLSGDLAFEGIKEQYKLCRKILGQIIVKLKQLYNITNHIDVLTVPGNHDINFNNVPLSRAEIQTRFFKNSEKEQIYAEFIKKMDGFFEFASDNRCFVSNKIVDVKQIQVGNYTIQFNLINSAINSILKDPIGDDDKGLHYIDDAEIAKMESNKNSDLIISIMHHSPEWYNETCRHKLLSYINNKTDFLLCGHEHINVESEVVQSEAKVTRICGGPLVFENKSIFNTIILNTDENKYKTCKYIWCNNIYQIENSEYKKIDNDIKINLTFYNDFINDQTFNNINDFREFFIFPELTEVNKEQKEQVINNKKMFELFEKKKMIIIEGDDYSGKTSLSKFIFLESLKSKVPVFFDMKRLNSVRINKIIDFAFTEQYNKTHYNKSNFLQELKINKIAIVDDADRIESQQFEFLIEELKKSFGTIVIFKGLKSQYDIIELANKHLDEENDTITLSICPIYSDTRELLIKKVCKVLVPNISDIELDTKTKEINNIIRNQMQIFNLNPYFIVLFVKTILASGYEKGEANVFNSVFVSNITNILKTNLKLDINVSLLILQRMAYYIHTNKEYPIKPASITKIISEYNEEGRGYRKPLNPVEIINDLVETRIINYYNDEGDVCFFNNSYLAYFIAKEWLKLTDLKELEKIVDNICFGINGEILLFICYLYENSQVLIFNTILERAESFFANFDELNFIKNNIKYFLNDKKKIELGLPNGREKLCKQKEIKEQEKRLTSKEKLKYINIYDYDENTITEAPMVFSRGIKYIEILAKTLPDFIHSMDINQIKKFVKAIYIYPNKLLFNVFKPVDDMIEHELTAKSIEEYGIVNYSEIDKTIITIKNISQTVLLNIYDMTARYAASNATIMALNNYNYQNNWNYCLQNAMFYDNIGETEIMGERLIKLCNDSDNKTIQNLAVRVYHKHLLFNNINYVGKIQQQISLFFPAINQQSKYLDNKTQIMKQIRTKIKK